MSYFILIVITVAISLTLGLTAGVNILHATEGQIFRNLFYSVLALTIIDAFFAILIRILPRKWFDPFKKVYTVHRWERRFYIFVGIKKWKSIIPETGGQLVGFAKRSLLDITDNNYIYKFMQETVMAEVMHLLGAIFSFLIVFINPKLFVVVGLPLMIMNIIINILPVMRLKKEKD